MTTRDDQAPDAYPIPDRACGTCTLCCELPDIDELDKPANELCGHCTRDVGCRAYQTRPATCRAFLCAWRTDEGLGAHWDPRVSHMMVYRQGPQFTVLVDPRYPRAWRNEPHLTELKERAGGDGEGYVIVFIGDEVVKIEPSMRD